LIFEATACERGQEGAEAPPVRVITVRQFADELDEEAAATPSEAQEREQIWNTAMQMLGLLPPDTGFVDAYSESSTANVAAYYNDETERITIIDRGGASDPLEDVVALSHEFVHALQDQELDLSDYRADHVTSNDSLVAVTSLIEGEATVLMFAVAGRAQGAAPHELNWAGGIDAMRGSIYDSIDASAAPFVTAIQLLPYPLGTEYLFQGWLQGGQAYINGVYDEPPPTVLDWESKVTAGRRSLAQPLDCYPTTPPAGYTAFDEDTLGVSGALGIWMSTGLPAEPAWHESVSWRGDRLVVFQSDTTPDVAVAWRTRWETRDAADAVAIALGDTEATGSRVTVVHGKEVTLFVASDADFVSAWAAAMECGSADDLASTRPLDSGTSGAFSSRRSRWH
jgi:hypothetical protein